MNNEKREKFWKGVFPGLRLSEGRIHWVSTVCRVADMYTRCWIDSDEQIVFCGEALSGPTNADEVRLEVLIDGWCRIAEVGYWPIKSGKQLRAAIIEAICKLEGE